MHLETRSRTAARLVSEAMDDLAAFRLSPEQDWLERARHKLDVAQEEDPRYLGAVYYRAIVDDLAGRASDAIPQLERVLEERPPYMDEAEYYLGVAYYHRYNRPSLERAIAHFSAVANRTQDELLMARARVGLMQAFGMRMVPADPERPDLDGIQKAYQALQRESVPVERWLEAATPADSLDDIRASFHNATAIGWMYWSDYFGGDNEKVSAVSRAIAALRQADAVRPKSWLTQCNLGSAWMRLGYWESSPAHFDEARGCLARVVHSLRPEYGFALYELGRIERLTGAFPKAVDYFNRARAIPYAFRDVSDRRLLIEQRRAESGSSIFP